ncbi:MAG: hypothetical protein P1V97_35750 [Planctomycetota bacterium]|nr:hypothetical protein [Planctomycetota bacterium]
MKTIIFCRECDLRHIMEEAAVVCECGHETKILNDPATGPEVKVCAICGYEHLHLRKEFPRPLGMAIVVVAAISMWWMPGKIFWLPLIIASLIDMALYHVLPWKVVCYVCSSEYSGYQPTDEQAPYDLETATEHQKLRWPKKTSIV